MNHNWTPVLGTQTPFNRLIGRGFVVLGLQIQGPQERGGAGLKSRELLEDRMIMFSEEG